MDDADRGHTGPPTWPVLLALVAAEVVAAFEAGMIFAAMSTFIRVFGDALSVGWLVTAYLLVGAGSAAIGGRLGDLYGRKRLLLAVMALACIGSLICGASEQYGWVLVGRAMQGAVGAALPLCYGLVRENVRGTQVAKAVGLVTATASVGTGLGIVAGGVIVDRLSWQWLFHVSAAGALVAGVLVATLVPGTAKRAAQAGLDLVGGLLFIPAIFGVLLAVSMAPRWGWADARTLGLLAAALALLWGWVVYELRHPRPLIDVRLFLRPQIALANVLMALLAMGAMQAQVMALLLQQPVWTGVGLGLSATVAGLIKIPSNFSGGLGAPWAGSIASRHGARRAMIACLVLLGAGWLALALSHGSPWMVGAVMLVTGFGVAGAFTSVSNLLLEVVPAERTSEATGLTAVVRNTFQGIGSQLVALSLASSVVTSPGGGPERYPSEAAFTLTLALIAGGCGLAALLALWLPHLARTSPLRMTTP